MYSLYCKWDIYFRQPVPDDVSLSVESVADLAEVSTSRNDGATFNENNLNKKKTQKHNVKPKKKKQKENRQLFTEDSGI